MKIYIYINMNIIYIYTYLIFQFQNVLNYHNDGHLRLYSWLAINMKVIASPEPTQGAGIPSPASPELEVPPEINDFV